MFIVLQLMFGIVLSLSFVIAHNNGEATIREVAMLIFVAIIISVIGLFVNSNLLKSRILSFKFKDAIKNDNDKNHLLFLIKERTIGSRRALITETILILMTGAYSLSIHQGFSQMMTLSLLIHGVVTCCMVCVQLYIDKKSKQGIELMMI